MVSKCLINMNNEFKNILFKLHLLNPNSLCLNDDRKKLFYFICIPFRILLCICIFLLFSHSTNQRQISVLFGLISLFTFIHLITKSLSCQWWSNGLECLYSFLLFCICVYCYFANCSCIPFVIVLFSLSIISGIFQSISIQPFL